MRQSGNIARAWRGRRAQVGITLLGGVSVLTLAWTPGLGAGAAQAQQASAPSKVAQAAAPPPLAQPGSVSEVVVTAEKRSAKLERVPDAISAFTSKTLSLKGINSVQDLTDYTPGLSYTTYDNRPYIRGIGRNSDNLAVESGVAVYLDGIYNGANGSTILQSDSLFVDQIEVLRGPQSTLYGRNSDGGAIDYISKRPTPDFQGEFRTGYDNYDKAFYEGAVSGPITDSIRFRVGGNYTHQTGGFYTNLNGAPEGGDVAQGGNGLSYHIEAQLEGNVGDKFDWWTKLATSDYDVTYHTEQLLGPLDTREFPNPLFPNPNFGTCALPGGAGGLGCAGNPDTIVSVNAGPNTIPGNPSAIDPRDFDSGQRSHAKEDRDWIVATHLTYHAPTFDIKYLFGYQTFDYALIAPWTNNQGVTSGILGYTLQGPTTPTPYCELLFHNTGCTQNLQVNSAHNAFTFGENEQFYSNELDLASTTRGPLQYVAGLYQYHETYVQPVDVVSNDQSQITTPYELLPIFAGQLVPAPADPNHGVYNEYTKLNEDSYGVFGQADWQVNDQFKFTAGVRYSYDRKEGDEAFRLVLFDADAVVPGFPLGVNQFGANTPALDATSCPTGKYPGAGACTINPNTGNGQRSLGADWDAVTGTVGLSWTPDRTTLGYLKYSRGYKAGGFNSGTLQIDPETNAETVDAFEGGIKKTFSNVFQANLSAFYYIYNNDQQPLNQIDPVGDVVNTLIINIPTAHIYGVELETIWNPIRDLDLSLNYSYLNATIASTDGQCYQDAEDPLAIAPGANTSGCAAGTGAQNLKGATLPEAPRNKVSLNALYQLHFNPGTFVLSGTYVWKDQTYDSVFNRSYNLSPSYSQVNLRGTWTDTANRYSVILYANNVFNTLGYDGSAGLLVTDPGPGQVIDRLASFTAPRVYGIELQFRFR